MTSRTLGFAALLASVAITSTVQAQIELNDSNTGVVISLRPQSGVLVASQEASKNDPPATESADKQDPDKPSDKDAEDAKEQDKKEDPDLDTPKSAGGSTPANGSDAGRLNPIAMESVRAPIGAANIAVADIGTKVLPEDQAAKLMNARMPLPGGQDRVFCGLTYRWQAANICHFPLYFEEPMLERHGQQCCPTWIQPAVSGDQVPVQRDSLSLQSDPSSCL